MNLDVDVSESLTLRAGLVSKINDRLLIAPPGQSMFDQLCDWLDQHPLPTVGFNYWVLGIGATALCLRWGTYLAVLMDRTKPIDPRAREPMTSMISDQEMKRINIEASSNFARLLGVWFQDEEKCFDTLRRAYEWLPMPQRRVKRDWQVFERIATTLQAVFDSADVESSENSENAESRPFRALATTIVSLTYRNGPIETIHAGTKPAYNVDHRRLTDRQAQHVMRITAERTSAIMSTYPLWDIPLPGLPPWPERAQGLPYVLFYPHNWSLTESSSQIELGTEWTG
jgi:hypothetical protein